MLPPRAYVFIGLNVIRIISIISLLLVLASNTVTLANDIKAVNRFEAASGNGTLSTLSNSTMRMTDYIAGSTVPNQPAGVFWAVLNRLLIIGQVIVLVFSELGVPANFFNRFFPVLGKDFGLGALGVIQMLIGAAVLSHRVDTFTLVSAFLLFSVGCLHVLLGLIFRERAKSKRSITSWRNEAKKVLPTPVQQGIHVAKSVSSHLSSGGGGGGGGSLSDQKNHFSGMGFGRQGEKAAAFKGYLITKPVESLPKYAPSASPRSILLKSTPTGESDKTEVGEA